MSPQELIAKSRIIRISLAPSAKSRDVADALILRYMLSKLGKNAFLEQKEMFAESFAWINADSLSAKTTVLVMKEIAPFISKISYEKDERDLRLALALTKDTLSLDCIALEQMPEADLTLIVGENVSQNNPDITLNPHAKLWNSKSSLEACFMLLSPFAIPQARLLQKILIKLEYTAHKNICITNLEGKDFRETQTNSKDISRVAQELPAWGDSQTSYLFLFPQNAHGYALQGLLWTNQRAQREKVSASFASQERGNWMLFQCKKKSVAETKEHILSLI